MIEEKRIKKRKPTRDNFDYIIISNLFRQVDRKYNGYLKNELKKLSRDEFIFCGLIRCGYSVKEAGTIIGMGSEATYKMLRTVSEELGIKNGEIKDYFEKRNLINHKPKRRQK